METGWHERSIRWVRSGRVDASVIDSHVLAVAFRDNPGLRSDLRIIGTLGPSTIQPLAVARRMPATLKSELRHLLLEMAEDLEAKDLLNQNFIERFVPIGDSDYDDIRRMSRAAESARF